MDNIASAGSPSNIMQTAIAAIDRAVGGVSRDAALVSTASIADSSQMLAALIDSRQQLLYIQAGAKMITRSNEMLGSLLDVRA
jgi:hypothetical protein